MLSECSVESVCLRIEAMIGQVYISGNDPGCNSKEEVELS